jgi:uncharacterized protein (DUF1800 family)
VETLSQVHVVSRRKRVAAAWNEDKTHLLQGRIGVAQIPGLSAQRDLAAAIAMTRFGLGAKAGEIAAAAGDPKGWLKAQIHREGAETFPTGGETSKQRLAEFRDYRRERRMADRKGEGKEGDADPTRMARRFIRQNAVGDVVARTQLAATTDAGFRERWALFWANHFTVSATKVQVSTLVGPYENEAIRPHVFGRFADLLGAAETHPAMLLYLDQAQAPAPGATARSPRPQRESGP